MTRIFVDSSVLIAASYSDSGASREEVARGSGLRIVLPQNLLEDIRK